MTLCEAITTLLLEPLFVLVGSLAAVFIAAFGGPFRIIVDGIGASMTALGGLHPASVVVFTVGGAVGIGTLVFRFFVGGGGGS